MSFIQQCINDGSLQVWLSTRRWNANLLDLSGMDRDGTPSSITYAGGGVRFNRDNGVITLASSITLADMSVMVLGHFSDTERAAAAESFLVSADNNAGGVIDWQFAIDDTPQLLVIDSANTRTLGVAYQGSRMVGFTCVERGTPIGYINELSAGNFSGTFEVGQAGEDIHFGNRDAADRSAINVLQDLLIWSDVLTASEVAILFGELMALPGGEN